MDVFHSFEITREYNEISSKSKTCVLPFNFIPRDTDEHAKSLKVELKDVPIKTIPGNKINDFIVIHERFVAVVEVNGLRGVEYAYIRLQASAAFVKSVMGSDADLVIINKILCCPEFREKEISFEAQNKMTSDSENMFIVCNDGHGFKTNLTDLLNRLQEADKTTPCSDHFKEVN